MDDGFDITPEQEAEYMAAMEEMDRAAGSGTVIDIKEGSERLRRKKRKEKPVGIEQAIREIIHAINGELQYLPSWFAKFPFPYRLVGYQHSPADGWIYYRMSQETRDLTPISIEQLTADVRRWTERLFVQDKEVQEIVNCYRLNYAGCEQVAKQWHCYADPIRDMPRSIGWLSEPETVVRRLPWDPIPGVMTPEYFADLCPTWAQIGGRMENWPAFLWRVGSLLDPKSDRRQAVFVWGDTNSGKSQIQAWLTRLAGTTAGTLNNSDLRMPWWKGQVVNKSVMTISEGNNKFLATDEFKAITGDEYHTVHSRYIHPYTARIYAKFFFFSNQQPATGGAEECNNRVISCNLANLPDDMPRIPGHELQRRLWDESRALMTYAWNAYNGHAGYVYSPDMASVHQANEDAAGDDLARLEVCFELRADSQMSSSDAVAIAQRHGVKGRDYQRMMMAAQKYRGVGQKRSGHCRGWIGIAAHERDRRAFGEAMDSI